MRTLRGWIVMSWIMLLGVMFGGSLLLRRLTVGEPDPFQATWIRAFHAHGGVLIMMSILYYMFMDRTTLSARTKHVSCLTLFVGIGAQVSGFPAACDYRSARPGIAWNRRDRLWGGTDCNGVDRPGVWCDACRAVALAPRRWTAATVWV
jgi:drug/metabolite transporter superfamily protein YnfA